MLFYRWLSLEVDEVISRLLQSLSLAFLLIIASTATAADGISGAYVGKASDSAYFIQIVQTADGNLSGRYEEISFNQNAELHDLNASLTGVAKDNTLVLSLKPAELFSTVIVLSGSLQDGILHLSGGSGGNRITLNLTRSDEADFLSYVAMLQDRVKNSKNLREAIEAAKSAARLESEQLARLKDVTQRVNSYSKNTRISTLKYPEIEQKFQKFTENMRALLAKERSLIGGNDTQYQRDNIAYKIDDMAFNIDSFHSDVVNARQDFDRSAGDLVSQSHELTKICRMRTAAPVVAAQQSPWVTACNSFFAVIKLAEERRIETMKLFSHLEEKWRSERKDQISIAQTATAIAR